MSRSPEYGSGTGRNGQPARNAQNGAHRETGRSDAFPSPSTMRAFNGSATTAGGQGVDTATATEMAHAWLDERGLDIELAARMGMDGILDKAGAVWLRIPYVRNGKTINRKYRKVGDKDFRNDPDSEHDLWNVDSLTDGELAGMPVIITEGELDALACIQAGHPRTVSVPNGWTNGLEDYDGQGKFADLLRNEDALREAPAIIIAGDNDATGWSFVRAVANFFPDSDVRSVRYRDKCKDPNAMLQKCGSEALAMQIACAKPVDPEGGIITGCDDLPPVPKQTVWKIGDDRLDKRMAFRSREISVLTGIPGSGKSTFARWIAHRLARKGNLKIGLAMFETDANELVDHLVKMHTGTDPHFLSKQDYNRAAVDLSRQFRIIHRTYGQRKNVTHGMLWLMQMIHKIAAREGCNLVIIDPWNELEHMPQPGESMTAYLNLALTTLRQWAEKYDIHIMVVAHPRKMQPGQIPMGYDVSDSAAWMNKPGMGYTVHLENDDEAGPHVSLTTWKVRSRQSTGCAPGTVKMHFDEGAMVYRPIQ